VLQFPLLCAVQPTDPLTLRGTRCN